MMAWVYLGVRDLTTSAEFAGFPRSRSIVAADEPSASVTSIHRSR